MFSVEVLCNWALTEEVLVLTWGFYLCCCGKFSVCLKFLQSVFSEAVVQYHLCMMDLVLM